MSTQYTINVGLGYWQLNDPGWHLPYQATCQLLDSLTPVGSLAVRMREIPSTSLSVSIAPGHFRSMAGVYVAYAGATIALPPLATVSLWLTDAGVLATGSAWPATAHVRLAIVTVGAGTIATVADARVAFGSATGTA
jgi:hypothetical protein